MNERVEDGAPSVTAGPGQMLAQLRAERKLSIADVAQRLKYGARQIEALEAEQFDKLPGATFVRGMVRGYAKLLETDPQSLLDALDQRYIPAEVDLDLRDKGIPFARDGKRGTRTYLAFSVLVLIVVAGILYEWRAGALPWARFASNTPPAQVQSKAAPVATPAAPPTETEVPAAPSRSVAEPPAAPVQQRPPGEGGGEGRIRLEFDSESWVEIRDRDGKTLMSQLNPAGSRRIVLGLPPLSLVIGNGAAVRLTYNDRPVDLKPHIQIEVARLTLD